jgi:VanZ family protein
MRAHNDGSPNGRGSVSLVSRARPARSSLFAALALLLAAMLVVCLWPFEFAPRNGAAWLGTAPGIRSTGLGMVASEESFPPLSSLSATGAITVEIAIRPAWIPRRALPHILSFCPDEGPPTLVVAAWKEGLVLRLGRPELTGGKRYRELGVPDAFKPGKTTLVTVVTGATGTTVYLDGRLATAAPEARLSDGAPLGRLLLASSPTGGGSWQGEILGLTIAGRALTAEEVRRGSDAAGPDGAPARPDELLVASYPFDEGAGTQIRNAVAPRYALTMPATYRPFRRAVLSLPARDARGAMFGVADVVLNVLGFIPFGFLAAWCLAAAAPSVLVRSLAAVLGGLALSLTIELAQVFLPSRTSSLSDLVANTAGTALGVAGLLLAERVIGRRGGRDEPAA